MIKKRKIGLKYCGGCRAQYNRVGVVKHMKKALEDRVDFISPDSKEAEYTLVISGCKTACADITEFSDRPVRFITSEEDAEVWIEEEKKRNK